MASYGISITGSGNYQVEINGEIMPLPEKGIVHTGSESTVVLTAIPGIGYEFQSWSYWLDGMGRVETSPVLTLRHPYGGSVQLNFRENAETRELNAFIESERLREEADKIAAYKVKFMELKGK
jgi:hypothetical protein